MQIEHWLGTVLTDPLLNSKMEEDDSDDEKRSIDDFSLADKSV